MEDTGDRIEQANEIANDALDFSRNFMRSMDDEYTIPAVTTPKNDAILVDPTYKTITPPTQPPYYQSSYNFPAIPSVGSFSGNLPSPPVFQGSSEAIDWSESKTQWLLDITTSTNTRDTIRELFNATGFEDVEIDMFEKGTEKDEQAIRDAEDAVFASMGSRGFGWPSDITNRELELKVYQPYEEATLKSNADIYLQQNDTAQKRAQFGITAGLNGEDILWGYASRMAARSLDAAIAIGGLGFELYKAKTRQYNAELRANRAHMEGEVQAEDSKINNYNEIISAYGQRLDAYVTAISLLKNNYRSALRGYKSQIRSEGEHASVIMSWRKGQWRENVIKNVAELEVDIANMKSKIATGKINTHIDSATAMYYVHYLSALLSSLQVVINESQAYQENTV